MIFCLLRNFKYISCIYMIKHPQECCIHSKAMYHKILKHSFYVKKNVVARYDESVAKFGS